MNLTPESKVYIEGLDNAGLLSLTLARISGTHGTPLCGGGGWDEEPAEEAVVCMLETLEGPQLEAVQWGCKVAAANVLAWLALGRPSPSAEEGAFQGLCNVLDMARPPRLKPHALAMWELVQDSEDVEVLGPVVRSLRRYRQSPEDASFWKKLAGRRQTAGHALQALIDLSVGCPVETTTLLLEACLRAWEGVVLGGWTVDVVLLMNRLGRDLGAKGDLLRKELISRLRGREDLWPTAVEALKKKPWSREWLGLDEERT